MTADNPIREPTLTFDGNLSPTPLGYTPPHQSHINHFPMPEGLRLDSNVEMPRCENLPNLPPQNQTTATTSTSFIPPFPPPPPYTLPFYPYYYLNNSIPYPPPDIVSTSPPSCPSINMPPS
jgi:hypothetical protein